jgi:hypothetical protein
MQLFASDVVKIHTAGRETVLAIDAREILQRGQERVIP